MEVGDMVIFTGTETFLRGPAHGRIVTIAERSVEIDLGTEWVWIPRDVLQKNLKGVERDEGEVRWWAA